MLIDAIERHRILYDKSWPDYKLTHKNLDAWTHVSAAVCKQAKDVARQFLRHL